jgi:hypothetical protein
MEECDDGHLIPPWSDPMEYEFSFDFLFDTKEDAENALEEYQVDPEESENWILYKRTLERVNADG